MTRKKSSWIWSTGTAATVIVASSVAWQIAERESGPVKRAGAAVTTAAARGHWAAAASTEPVIADEGVRHDLRYTPTTRPFQPEPQHPPVATTENSDFGKPPQQWQRLTDDWLGLRPVLDDRGISFQGNITQYFGDNMQGGAVTRHGGYSALFNVNVTLDSQKLLGYQGGTLFANFREQSGLSNSLDSSLIPTSHLYVPRRTELSELWYEQKFGDKLRVRAGKIDVNTEFDTIDNSAEFLNGNMSSSPTIVGLPTDPDPSIGTDVFIYPTPHFFAGAGLFDGSLHEGSFTGDLGPAGKFKSLFLIAEAGVTWSLQTGLDGECAAGVWHHTGTFKRFDGTNQNGTSGPYISIDQVIWLKHADQDDNHQGLAMFALAGYADPSLSAATFQVGGGTKWTGPWDRRPDDVAGLGLNYNRLSDSVGAGFNPLDELTIEGFYKFRFNTWLSIQPDLQYIHHSGGQSRHSDALAATVQISIDL